MCGSCSLYGVVGDEYLCRVYGVFLLGVWGMCDGSTFCVLCVVCMCGVYGVCMVCVWCVHGGCMVSFVAADGLFCVCRGCRGRVDLLCVRLLYSAVSTHHPLSMSLICRRLISYYYPSHSTAVLFPHISTIHRILSLPHLHLHTI